MHKKNLFLPYRRVDLIRRLFMVFWLRFLLGVQCDLSNGFVHNYFNLPPHFNPLSTNVIVDGFGTRSSTAAATTTRNNKNAGEHSSRRHRRSTLTTILKLSKKDDDESSNKKVDDVKIDTNFDFVDARLKDPKFLERNKRWIIVVDDEEAIRLAVGDFLYQEGYQVTACADADTMLQVCSEPRSSSSSSSDGDYGGEPPPVPDVIISDIRMPGKDGIELLGLIRADERLGRVPVILLTAKAMTQDRVEGYKAGADVYLSKPFDPNELLSIIDNAIQRRQQMSGRNGSLVDLKQDMETVKQIMRKNSASVVKQTDVYLTDAERDVLELVCKGYTNAEIASERGVNVMTVNRGIQKIYLDTGTRTRTELVKWAITTGYVSARTT